ncbi:MAG: pyrroline-5-carboxylate reductase [Clostridia bacterium]
MKKRLAIIGGGQMAEAILKGGLSSAIFSSEDLLISDVNTDRCNYLEDTFKVQTTKDNRQAFEFGDYVILAVKPQNMKTVISDFIGLCENKVIITIAAGLSLKFYLDILGGCRGLVRVMPNTPCLVKKGVSALTCADGLSSEDKVKVEEIFTALGVAFWTEEIMMNKITAISGSGPAYFFKFIQALSDGGVQIGLPRQLAKELAIETAIGSMEFLKETAIHPTACIDMVTSPGGTTIAAIKKLEELGMHNAIMEAVEACYNKANQMS